MMEPISYFLTFGTSIIGYLFYAITKREYTFEILGEVTFTRRQLRMYKRRQLDINEYMNLKKTLDTEKASLGKVAIDYGKILDVVDARK